MGYNFVAGNRGLTLSHSFSRCCCCQFVGS